MSAPFTLVMVREEGRQGVLSLGVMVTLGSAHLGRMVHLGRGVSLGGVSTEGRGYRYRKD